MSTALPSITPGMGGLSGHVGHVLLALSPADLFQGLAGHKITCTETSESRQEQIPS